MKQFASCHCHPASIDSGATPEAMALREVELGSGALVATDHGSMASARAIYDLAKKNSLTPVLGLEAYFRDDNCPILAAHGIPKNDAGTYKDYWKYGHLTMWALDQGAFETMVRLLSKAELNRVESGKPLFDWADLEELGGANVAFGTGCLVGMVQRHGLDNQRPDIGNAYYERLRSTVKPGNFYVEVFPHVCDSNWESVVFMTLEGKEEQRCKPDLTIRVKYGKEVEEITYSALADRWKRSLDKKKEPTETHLLATRYYSKWTEVEGEPKVLSIRHVDGIIMNECSAWAPNGDVQKPGNEQVLALAEKYGDPVLISDDAHFGHEEDKIVQDVRLGNWRFANSYHRQENAEAFSYLNSTLGIDVGTFEAWVDNTQGWLSRFGWKFKDRRSLPTKFYPEDSLGHTMTLIRQTGRMDWNDPVRVERLKAELEMLHRNGTIDLLPYFFVLNEVVGVYEQQGRITGPGRGSAAGLLLSYLLGITHVDPLRYNLSKERFLTTERIKSGKLPDIDQDLPERDFLLHPETGYLKQRFGDHWAAISTDTQLRLKSSIYDVHRMKGSVPPDVAALASKMTVPPQGISDRDFVFGYEDSTGTHVKGSIETDVNLKKYVQKYPNEWAIVQKCLGVTRQKSRHACGNVICNEPVSNFIPLTKVGGVPVTAYTAGAVEAAGGIKMDFLGVNSLKDIEACIRLLQEESGLYPSEATINGKRVPGLRLVQDPTTTAECYFDVWDLPEDQDVMKSICQGADKSVFQFGTGAARQWLQEFVVNGEHKLTSIEHLSAFTALDRPGPLDYFVEGNGTKRNMLQEYAARAKGLPAIGANETLNKLFPETYGIIVYQEQLQRAYQVLGKTSPEKADEFRVHIAKKMMTKVYKDRDDFLPGAIEQVGEEEATRLWQMMETFGQYGFNKSHAVSYTVLGYACAYLRFHYPLQWWCAVLRNADRNEIDAHFWKYAGHYILPPDVARSGEDFVIEGDKIRAPLRLLTGIGPTAHEQLMAGRPYKDVRDLIQRVEDYKAVKESFTDKKGVTKERKRRSAINRSILTRLTLAESLDSLFPPDVVDAYAKLDVLYTTYAQVRGEPKIPTVDDQYRNLNQLRRYMLKKTVLPGYTMDVTKEAIRMLKYGVNLSPNFMRSGERWRWHLEKAFYHDRRAGDKEETCAWINSEALSAMLEGKLSLPPKMAVAVLGYIVEAERFWGGKALKVRYDVDGERFESILWPNRSGDQPKPAELPEGAEGGLCMIALSRYEFGKDFAIHSVDVIEPAFKDGKDSE